MSLWGRFSRVDGAYAGVALVSLLPGLCVRFPQSADYLNHMARVFILTAPAGHPVHQYYAVHWHLLANLGLEIVALPLSLLIGVAAAMKVVWCLCVLGLAGGGWFLHRALFARTQPTLLLAGLMLLNLPLSVGLLNFLMGITLALFGAGIWIRFGERPSMRQVAAFNLISITAFLFHVSAGMALGLTVGCVHAVRGLRIDVRRAGIVACGFVLPLLLMAFLTLGRAHPMGLSASGIVYHLSSKRGLLSAPSYVGIAAADFIGTVVTVGGLLLLTVFGRVRVSARLGGTLIVWAGLLIVLPFEIGVASYIDIRLALVAGVLLVASLSCAVPVTGWRLWLRRGVAAAAVIGVPQRVGLMMPQWLAHQEHIESFLRLESRLPMGAKVLVAKTEWPHPTACTKPFHWESYDEHIPVLLTLDKAAFVSTVFADPDMQPIRPTAQVKGYTYPNAGIVPWQVLHDGQHGERDPAFAARLPRGALLNYPVHWFRRYDYLAVRQMPCDPPFSAPADLTEIGRSETYRLYRIEK